MNDAVVESDEIDLGALIRTLVEHWASLVGGVLIGVFSGLAVWQMSPFVTEYEIRPIAQVEQSRLTSLNGFLVELKLPEITAARGLIEYITALSDVELFVEAAMPTLRRTAVNELDTEKKARDIWRGTELLDPNYDEKRRTGSKFHILKVTTNETEVTQRILRDWVARLNQEVKRDMVGVLEARARLVDEGLVRVAEDRVRDAEYALQDYRKRAAARVALLSEQASIARKLGLKKATIESTVFEGKNSLVANVKTDSPLYLRGYEALEKEISLITSRKTERDFVSGLIEVEAKLRAAKDDPTARRLRELIRTSPLTDPQFQVVTIDVAPDAFARSKGWPMLGALGAMAGGFVALLYVFARVAYRRSVERPGN